MNVVIVKNRQGLYAIRWGIWPFYRYIDLQTPSMWWWKSSFYFSCCWADRDRVLRMYDRLNFNHEEAVVDATELRKELRGEDE